MPETSGGVPAIGRLAIVGLGLIGSSIARAARRYNLARTIVAVDRDEAVRDRVRELGPVPVLSTLPPMATVTQNGEPGEERVAACLVRADTRADVNNLVKRTLDVRKCSFLPMERATAESGMEFGGITPVGLPREWPVLVDEAVLDQPWVVVGSGTRGSKLLLPGARLASRE